MLAALKVIAGKIIQSEAFKAGAKKVATDVAVGAASSFFNGKKGEQEGDEPPSHSSRAGGGGGYQSSDSVANPQGHIKDVSAKTMQLMEFARDGINTMRRVTAETTDPNSSGAGNLNAAAGWMKQSEVPMVKLAGATTEVVASMRQWTKELIDGQMKLRDFSGQIAAASLEKEAGDVRRNLRQAQQVGASARDLQAADSRLKDAVQPWNALGTRISNNFNAFVTDKLAIMAEGITAIGVNTGVLAENSEVDPTPVADFIADKAMGLPPAPWAAGGGVDPFADKRAKE